MGLFASKVKNIIPVSTRIMSESSEIQQFIKSTINEEKVVVFSKSYCPYCNMAKEVFSKVKQPIKVIELDQRNDGPNIQENLASLTGIRTVPQVFINGKCVGGGSDVKALYDKGALEPMLIEKYNKHSRIYKGTSYVPVHGQS